MWRTPMIGVALACLLSAGCANTAGSGDEAATSPTPSPHSASPTPLSRLNTAAMDAARGDFCARVTTDAVRAAVGGDPGRGTAWGSGAKAEFEPGQSDVVHEFGCRWEHAGTVAGAWVFARPLDQTTAQQVIDQTSRRKGCRSGTGAGFGSPSQRQTCTLPDGSRRLRSAGLIGQTWVSCQLSAPASVPETDLAARTDAWCVQIANATNGPR